MIAILFIFISSKSNHMSGLLEKLISRMILSSHQSHNLMGLFKI